jgi:hypothetical protein
MNGPAAAHRPSALARVMRGALGRLGRPVIGGRPATPCAAARTFRRLAWLPTIDSVAWGSRSSRALLPPRCSTTVGAASWAWPQALHEELRESRNFKLWFKRGAVLGTLMTGVEQWLMPRLGIRTPPWMLHGRRADHSSLRPADQCEPIAYPKPDGKLSFDRLSSVYLSNTHHAEDQPVHLSLRDAAVPVAVNLHIYAGPESRYCPAGVYEFLKNDKGEDRLRSTRGTAFIARPATSRTRRRTSCGSHRKAVMVRAMTRCSFVRNFNRASRCCLPGNIKMWASYLPIALSSF